MRGDRIVRSILTTAAEVAGLASIAAGCWLVAVPLGLVAAGAALIVIGVTNA